MGKQGWFVSRPVALNRALVMSVTTLIVAFGIVPGASAQLATPTAGQPQLGAQPAIPGQLPGQQPGQPGATTPVAGGMIGGGPICPICGGNMGRGGMQGSFSPGGCPFGMANCPFMNRGGATGTSTGLNSNGTGLPAAPAATATANQDLNRNGIPDSQESALNFSNQIAGARTTTGPAAPITTPVQPATNPAPAAAPLATPAAPTTTAAPTPR